MKGYKIFIIYKMKYYSAIKEGNLAFATKGYYAKWHVRQKIKVLLIDIENRLMVANCRCLPGEGVGLWGGNMSKECQKSTTLQL